ncbi:MAG: hypothetical protein ACREVZ_08320 [Burkholderiales bacterium]
MRSTFFAGLVLALSPLAPAISSTGLYDVGALRVEQVSNRGPALAKMVGDWRDTDDNIY